MFSELLFCRNAALELICVEPALENFQLLEKNTSNFAPHATLYNVAIGNPSGNLPQREVR